MKMSPLVSWLLILGGIGVLLYTMVVDRSREQKVLFYLMGLWYTTWGGWLVLRDQHPLTVIVPLILFVAVLIYLVGYIGYWRNRRLWRWMENEWMKED